MQRKSQKGGYRFLVSLLLHKIDGFTTPIWRLIFFLSEQGFFSIPGTRDSACIRVPLSRTAQNFCFPFVLVHSRRLSRLRHRALPFCNTRGRAASAQGCRRPRSGWPRGSQSHLHTFSLDGEIIYCAGYPRRQILSCFGMSSPTTDFWDCS